MAFGQQSLTVEQALEQVLRANLRLDVSRMDVAAAEERRMAEWGIFEPHFLLSAAREANDRENTVQQYLATTTKVFQEHNKVFSASLESILPTGATIKLGSQLKGLHNNLQVYGNDEWDSFTGVTLTQPLLKDRGWDAVSAKIRLATADSAIAREEFRGQIALVLSEAEFAYWEVVAADQLIEFRQRSMEVAQRMLKDNRDRVKAGRMTDLDVLQAEAGVAVRRSNLADARQRRADAEARLDNFLGRTVVDAQPFDLVSPLLPESPLTVPAIEDAVKSLLMSHPAYRAQMERIKQARIRVAYAKNQRLPQVDLKASYGLNGLGSTWSDSYDRALKPAFREDHESWYVGLELDVPILGNRQGRHAEAAANIRKRQELFKLAAIQLELTDGVQALITRINSLRERVEALSGVVEAQRRVLDNENNLLQAGRSDSRDVLQAEQDLSQAEIEALQARMELRHALVELAVKDGTYLSDRNFDLADE